MTFWNLEAEQARYAMTNEKTAQHLGITRAAYETKKKNGRFTIEEIKKLCELFGCGFDYLFSTDREKAGA